MMASYVQLKTNHSCKWVGAGISRFPIERNQTVPVLSEGAVIKEIGGTNIYTDTMIANIDFQGTLVDKSKRSLDVFTKRLLFLEKNLDEEQDVALFEKSRNVFCRMIVHIPFDVSPKLSVDDAGVLMAEWRKYHGFDFIVLRFADEIVVSLVAVRGGFRKSVTGTWKDIVSEFRVLERHV